MTTKSKADMKGSAKSSFHNLNKSSDTKQTVSDIITNLIIEKLEAGCVPWRKPWNSTGGAKNLITNKPYRGVNQFILNCYGTSQYYATFKQVQDKKGTIKKGSKSIPICFYSMGETTDRTTGEDTTIPILRFYRVFSFDDILGIPVPVQEATTREFNPIEEAERIVKNMPFLPEIKAGGSKAYYSPSLDYIGMPESKLFHTDAEYYSTLNHELIHATGHSSRLNRSSVVKTAHYGSSEYSREELIAECGASMLNAHAGIVNSVIDNSAAYIQGWLKVLKSKDNKGLIITAASAGQKACDYILNVPAYTEA